MTAVEILGLKEVCQVLVVGEAKEGIYFLDFGGDWPGSNAIKFHQVHDKLTGFYDHSEVFDFRDIKLALLEL